ncbi:Heme/hemopexin transporter protein huxB [Agrobacterium tumefaciens]|uniref:ShlB/FhaC/HecB family hemolysin secretion/activation protein n=1 Tax=Agrobacterium tumefaciens TaxID=358 RepID=UPI001AD9D1E6|nr:ShlB/FhaC/HecB family hemolysin secretion/activation protein [Agrobacterium tumefaciens]QTK81975.1 Heme/hemopexin transporter protein huxB [Agrobacterium tumefaciens]
MSRAVLPGLALAAQLCAPALAQDAGALLRDREVQSVQTPPKALPLKAKDNRSEAGTVASGGMTVKVSHLIFSGKTSLLSPDERTRLVDAAAGKVFDLAGLRDLTSQVTRLAQSKGRMFARAFLPPQDVTEGVVEIALMEARVEDVGLVRVGSVRVRDEILRGVEHRYLQDRYSMTEQQLEAALLQMNSLPGLKVRASVEAGDSPGTSKVSIGIEEGPLFSGHIWTDSFGSASTGRAEGNALVSLSDPLGYGEQFRFQSVASQGMAYGRFSGSAPLGSAGTFLNGAYSYLTYRDVTDTGRAAGLEGDGHQLAFGLTHPILRDRATEVTFGGVVTGKALRNGSAAGDIDDKRLLTGTLSLSGVQRDFGGTTNWGLDVTYGALDLSRVATSAAAAAAGLRTEGGFSRLNARIERQQRLADRWTLIARVSGQWASTNLDSSEEIALGGPYAVRGWPIGEASADTGAIGTLELRHDLAVPEEWGQFRLGGFLDGGYAKINARPRGTALSTATKENEYALFATGLTLGWQRENLSLTAGWGMGLGDNPGRSANGANVDGGTGRHQFWLSGRVSF